MEDMTKEYIFAIDRTKKPTQKRIVSQISKDIGTGKVELIEPHEISESIRWKDFMLINLKMKSSDVFKDGEPAEDAEDPEAEAEKLKFPWHSEKGIIENGRMLNIEFNQNRNLKPVKMFISGPPASGKTFYSNRIT
jgi:adenylate kinase